MQLIESQIKEFNENGYLVLPAVFSSEEVSKMGDAADEILQLVINTSLALGEQDVRLRVQNQNGLLNVQKVQPINDISPYVMTISEDDRLVEPLRQLLGGHEPILMEEKLNYKQLLHQPLDLSAFKAPNTGDSFPLHHDWGYYRQQGYLSATLSSAISIDNSTPDNGPLRVIPGTHKQDWPLINPDPTDGRGELIEATFEGMERVQILAPGGSVMLFHSRLVHDSTPNTTGRPRRIMIYSHYPAYHQAAPDERNQPVRERVSGMLPYTQTIISAAK